MESLKVAFNRLSEVEAEILRDLTEIEEKAVNHLRESRKELENSTLKKIELELGDNFQKIENFGSKLKTVADESDVALNGLKKGVNIVETVSSLYNSASKTLDLLNTESSDEAFAEIEKYISSVEKAKKDGYWQDVTEVISKGYIGQVISSLKSLVLDLLSSNILSHNSKLLTKLALCLNAEKEAYESYISSIKMENEKKTVSNLLTGPGSEVQCLKRVIQNARNLLTRQGTCIFSELGAFYYVKIAREIHSYASSEASNIFIHFVKHNFSGLLTAQSHRSNYFIDDLIDEVKLNSVVESLSSDPKNQKILDNIALMASLWTGFESLLRENTTPIYSKLVLKAQDPNFGKDGLVILSDATKNLQSILSIYVHLQHSFTLKAVVQAIQTTDTIYISQDENTLTSTLVDDVFFILQKSQHRSIATGDIQTACATFNQISAIISNELKNALMQNIVQSQTIYERWTQKMENLINSSLFAMLDDYFKKTRGNFPEFISSKYSFVHCLNNIEECLGLLSKFKLEMTECFAAEFLTDKNNLLVDNTIQELDLVKNELEQILETCCQHTVNIFKDHLNEPLTKISLCDFQMDEDKYTKFQSDSLIDGLVAPLQVILNHINSYYLPNVGLKCMNNLLQMLCKYLERMILEKNFTIYGAVYLDNIIRSLLYASCKFNQSVRKEFTTLLQISDVLNVNNTDDLMLLKGNKYHHIASESEYIIDIYKYSSLRTDLNL